MKKDICSLGKIDYSVDGNPKLVNQNWKVREDLCETIAVFIRDSLREFLKCDICVHMPMEKAYENDMKVQTGKISEEERCLLDKAYKETWKAKAERVIAVFDKYVTVYNGGIPNTERSGLVEEGVDRLKEIFEELVL